MRIAVAGGNSFIGQRLTRILLSAGHEVVWLSHRVGRSALASEVSREVLFNPAEPETWAAEVSSAAVVVNLSGYPIADRWNSHTKQLMYESRIATTRVLAQQAARAYAAGGRPTALVNASAVGIYGDRGDDLLRESEPAGGDWLARLAADWEGATAEARSAGIRTVAVRTGIVLGDKGALPLMALAMRMFVGGPLGTGRQWFPWIHQDDVVALYQFAIESDTLSGAVNAVSPQAVRMAEFARAVGHALGRPSWLPVPYLGLRLVIGEAAASMLASMHVSAERALAAGFVFAHPDLSEALADLLAA